MYTIFSIDVANQRPRNLLQHRQTGRQRQTPVTLQNELNSEVALAKKKMLKTLVLKNF